VEILSRRYDSVSIRLHWLIAIGVIVVGLAEMFRGDLFAKGSAPREILKALHEPVGLVIFVLIVARIMWRLAHTPPTMPSDMRSWEIFAAKLTHVTLYALLIAVPLLGLATTYVRGKPISFGLFQIAVPVGTVVAKDTARLIKGAHELTSQLILAVAFVHAAAAIWHHTVRKDDVLTRMSPRHGTSQT
jgi:cytochrome b561